MKTPLQPVLPLTATSAQSKRSLNPFQLLQTKNAVENPLQQLKKKEILQPAFNPLQLLAQSLPSIQFTKLPNLARAGPEFYIAGIATEPKFTKNHRVDTAGDFTTGEAKKRGIARTGERKNSIVKMDSSELNHELKKIIREDVTNEDYTSNSEMGGDTSKAYPWITSVKDGTKPMKFEGGECILKLGVKKIPKAPHLWISHLDSGPLNNNKTWIDNKLTAEAAAEAEAARLAAEEEAAAIAAAEEDARLAATEEEEEEETPEEAAKRKAKNKKKNEKRRAARQAASVATAS